MGAAVRVGLSFAAAPDARSRWRLIGVAAAAFLLAAGLTGTMGVVSATLQAQARTAALLPILTDEPDETIALARIFGPIVEDRQFPMVWLQPGPVPGPPPPGLRDWPEPGTAVVSPGLVHAGYDAQALGFEPSTAGAAGDAVIGPEGVATLTQWLVYAAPAPGRDLGSTGNVTRISGFGPRPDEPRAAVLTDEESPSPAQAVGLVGLVLPALLLLAWSAVRADERLRWARAHRLARLGLSRREVRLVAAAEVAGPALPAAVAGAVAAAVGLSQVSAIPLVPLVWVPGDLSAGALAAAAAAAVSVALMLAMALPPAKVVTGRTTPPHVVSLLPLLAGLALMVVARSPGARSPELMLAAMLVVLVSIPLALPWLVRRVAPLSARAADSRIWLASRRLAHQPGPLARPAAVLGSLVFLLGALTGITTAIATQQQIPAEDTAVVLLEWADPRPGDEQALTAALPAQAMLLPVASIDVGADTVTVVGATCTQAGQILSLPPAEACTPAGELTPQAEEGVSVRYGWQVQPPQTLPAPADPDRGATLIIGTGLDPTTVTRAAHDLPGYNMSWLSDLPLAPQRLAEWIVGFATLGIALLGLAATHAFADRLATQARESAAAIRASLDTDQQAVVVGISLALPAVLAVAVGTTCAAVFRGTAPDIDLSRSVGTPLLIQALAATTLALTLSAAVVHTLQRQARSRPSNQ